MLCNSPSNISVHFITRRSLIGRLFSQERTLSLLSAVLPPVPCHLRLLRPCQLPLLIH